MNLIDLDKLSTELTVEGVKKYTRKCADGTWIWKQKDNEELLESKSFIEEEE